MSVEDLQRGFVAEVKGGEEGEEELGKKEHQNGERYVRGASILKIISTRNKRILSIEY